MSRRKRKKISSRNIVILICGGETEEWYFKNFKSHDSDIIIYYDCKHSRSSPMKLVKRAIKLKEQFECTWRKIFVIFDKDDFPDFDEAIKFARKNDIVPIFSNQAFELWFLQFFECYRNPVDRKQYEKKLNEYLKRSNYNFKYDKKEDNVNKMYSKLKKRVPKALHNSEIAYQEKNLIHLQDKKKFSELESVSNVHILVDYLNKL